MTRMGKQNQRAVEIVSLLKDGQFLSIQELAARLRVSSMTIRRDLEKLQENRIIKQVPGGAIINDASTVDKNSSYSLLSESCLNRNAKIQIGRKAAELVCPHDSIIIDSGTTTEFLAKFLPDNIELTVLCYTLNVLFSILEKKQCKKVLAGGHYHENTMLFDSPEGIQQIRQFRANKAFIGATGFSSQLGITCSNEGEPIIKQTALESSQEKILMIDSSKFDFVRPYYFAEPEAFDIIITDTGIPDAYRKYLEDLDVNLILV